MKFSSVLLSITFLAMACGGNGPKQPDVSGINVNTKVERFDKAYFALDSNDLANGMKSLARQYPYFINDFTANILGAGIQSDTNNVLKQANQHFFTSYYSVFQGLKDDFADLTPIEKELAEGFEKSYIATNCVRAVAEDLFPDKSQGLPLIEQMIEKGKYAWLTNLVLPHTADTIKTGYTKEQANWCASNEGVVWNLILQNDQLYSTDPSIIQMYIGDAPGTQNFPPAAPGNLGQWIGQRIVKAYLDKNPATTPDQLMKMPAREIIDGAKYKPR